jgi:hypothetical protein
VTRRLSFAGGTAAAAVAAIAVTAFAGSGDACAQSGDAVAPRLTCEGGTTATAADPTVVDTPQTCSTASLLRTVAVPPSGRGVASPSRAGGPPP